MTSTLEIKGRINYRMVKKVKSFLKNVPTEGEVEFEIDSHGGNMEALRRLKGFMYFMYKYKKVSIRGKLIYGESAALLLFLNCNIRSVDKASVGVIHLPKLNRRGNIALLQKERRIQAEFIRRRCNQKINLDDIMRYEHKKLSAPLLLQFGMATTDR